MSRKPQPAQSGDKARLEVIFDKPQLLGQVFGQYDQNLVAIENALGVYIAARGNKLQIEGEAESIARARDVLTGLYNRIVHGQEKSIAVNSFFVTQGLGIGFSQGKRGVFDGVVLVDVEVTLYLNG